MDRKQVEQFIHANFAGISQDYLWEDTPDASVIRHTDNHKWFALLMKMPYSTLGLNRPGEVDFINLKSDPDLIETLTHESGILPAYHMNKRHWLTVLLDDSVDPARLKSLIDISFTLTAKKRSAIINKDYDNCKEG